MDEQEALDSQNQDLNRTSLVLRVRPGCETAYETLQAGLLEETRRFPGFKGEKVMRPTDPDRPEYTVTLHFENGEAKERWSRSEERRQWVEGMEALADTPVITILSGLETWFTLPGDGHTKTAPRYKTAFVVWIAIFPTVLVLSILVSRLPFEMSQVASVLVITAVTVPTAVYILLPRLTRLFERWLYQESWGTAQRPNQKE